MSTVIVMTCLNIFAIVVMIEYMQEISVLIPKFNVKLIRIIIVNLVVTRRILARNLQTKYEIARILILIIQFSINLSIMGIRALIISNHLGMDIIIMPTILIAVIIHPTIITTFKVISNIAILIVICRSIRMSSV